MQFHHDSADQEQRLARLSGYISRNLLHGDDFVCTSFRSPCEASALATGCAFIEAEMPHVGDWYSLRAPDGTPVRILVLGQERGRGQPRVSMAARTKDLQIKRDFSLRNPHRRGTVYALVVALGGDVRLAEHATVDGERRHVIDMFTLTNATLCSALKKKPDGTLTTKGKATPQMRSTCVRHLRAQIDILEPTLLIAQGVNALSSISTIAGRKLSSPSSQLLQLGSHQTRVVALAHPTSHSPTNWPSHTTEYFRACVAPLVRGS